MAWPRLAEYFARFQLSLGLQCSLQVMAPMLSTVPLFIRPKQELESGESKISKNAKLKEEEKDAQTIHNGKLIIDNPKLRPQSEDDTFYWIDEVYDILDENIPLESESSNNETVDVLENKKVDTKSEEVNSSVEDIDGHTSETFYHLPTQNEEHRKQLLRATTSYLNKPVQLKNIAHSIQPIRRKGYNRKKKHLGPMLEVDLIVHGLDDDDDDDGCENEDRIHLTYSDHANKYLSQPENSQTESAKISVIRMVNHVPLLDSAEASACGLIARIDAKNNMWNSFGLEVKKAQTSQQLPLRHQNYIKAKTSDLIRSELYIPTFSLEDSIQVAPFFQSSTHSMFKHSKAKHNLENQRQRECEDDDLDIENEGHSTSFPLPAGIRIGNILIIIKLHATPSELPLPTLSKVSYRYNIFYFPSYRLNIILILSSTKIKR